jgi:phosphoribosylformylglycinamidine synthase
MSDPLCKPRVAVIQFPGGNCESETARALEAAGCGAEIFRWNRDPGQLEDFEAMVIGGGFSYQDRVRAGVIAAHEPIGERLAALAEAGRPILGICNGAQILVELGLVPGLSRGRVEMALAPNKMVRGGQVVRRDYYCIWTFVQLGADPGRCVWTRRFAPGEVMALPLAHGEGRFKAEEESLFDTLEANDQVVWRYCDLAGRVDPEFPVTPNGSTRAIAGICNRAGNVLALMPHPERSSWLRQVPQDLPGEFGARRRAAAGDLAALEGAGPGRGLFESLAAALAAD